MKKKIVSSKRGIHSPEFLRRKKKIRLIKRISAALGIILFVAGIIFLMRSEKLLINQISISGETLGGEEIIEEAQKILLGKYFWLIPRSNAFFYPKDEITAALNEKFPRFKSISLNLEGLDKLAITVEEREPAALYCQNANACFFMDDTGFIFSEAPTFSSDVYLPYYSESYIIDPVGESYVSSVEFSKLKEFVASLPQLGIEPVAAKTLERHYEIELPAGGILMWPRDTEAARAYSNLEAFLSSPEIKSQEDFLERIETLDLRTENKVFFKFRSNGQELLEQTE